MGVDGGTWDGLLWTCFFSRLTKDHIQVSPCHLTVNLSFDNLWMVPLLGFICSNHSFWPLQSMSKLVGKAGETAKLSLRRARKDVSGQCHICEAH